MLPIRELAKEHTRPIRKVLATKALMPIMITD